MASNPDNKSTRQMLVVVGALVVVCAVVFAWSRVLFPVIGAFLLAYLSHPIATFFERRRLPRVLGFVTVVLCFVALGAFVLLVFLPAVVHELTLIGDRLPTWREVWDERIGPFLKDFQTRYPELYTQAQQKLTAWAEENAPSVAERVASWIAGLLGSALSLAGVLLNLVLIPVMAAYMTVDFRSFVGTIRQLIPRPVLGSVEEVAREVHDVIGAFVRGQLLIALALGVMYTGGLLIVRAPLALVIGPLAGLLSLVPYLGLVLGAGTSFLLAFFEYQDLWHPVGVLAAFAAAQVVEAWVLTPKLVGKSVGLHPVWVLVALLVGGEMAGLPGIIVGVPVAAALRVLLIRALESYRRTHFYLGSRRLVVYTRQECKLCAEVEKTLGPEIERAGWTVERVDIDSDPTLKARYDERVPVVAIDGEIIAEGNVGANDLVERVRAAIEGGR